MKNLKLIISITILSIFFNLLSFNDTKAADPPRIKEIRAEYTKWQKVIKNKLKKADVLYMYYDEELYRNDEENDIDIESNYKKYQIWLKNQIVDETKIEYEQFDKFRIITDDKLGTYINQFTTSLSGDWSIVTDYYYDKNDKLIFIYWNATTTYSETGLSTTERRLYFDENGKLIRRLEKTFDPRTKKKVNSFQEFNEVEYKIDLKEMDFYPHWKNTDE